MEFWNRAIICVGLRNLKCRTPTSTYGEDFPSPTFFIASAKQGYNDRNTLFDMVLTNQAKPFENKTQFFFCSSSFLFSFSFIKTEWSWSFRLVCSKFLQTSIQHARSLAMICILQRSFTRMWCEFVAESLREWGKAKVISFTNANQATENMILGRAARVAFYNLSRWICILQLLTQNRFPLTLRTILLCDNIRIFCIFNLAFVPSPRSLNIRLTI